MPQGANGSEALQGAWEQVCLALESERISKATLSQAINQLEAALVDTLQDDLTLDGFNKVIDAQLQRRPLQLAQAQSQTMNALLLHNCHELNRLTSNPDNDKKSYQLSFAVYLFLKIRGQQDDNLSFIASDFADNVYEHDDFAQLIVQPPLSALPRDLTIFKNEIDYPKMLGAELLTRVHYAEEKLLQDAWDELIAALPYIEAEPKRFLDVLMRLHHWVVATHEIHREQTDANTFSMAFRQLALFYRPITLTAHEADILRGYADRFSDAAVQSMPGRPAEQQSQAMASLMYLTQRCSDLLTVTQGIQTRERAQSDIRTAGKRPKVQHDPLVAHYVSIAVRRNPVALQLQDSDTLYYEDTFTQWIDYVLYRLSLYVIDNPKLDQQHFSQSTVALLIEEGLKLANPRARQPVPLSRMFRFARKALEQEVVDEDLRAILDDIFLSIPHFDAHYQLDASFAENLTCLDKLELSGACHAHLQETEYKNHAYFNRMAQKAAGDLATLDRQFQDEQDRCDALLREEHERYNQATKALADGQREIQQSTMRNAESQRRLSALSTARDEAFAAFRAIQTQISTNKIEHQEERAALQSTQAYYERRRDALSPEAIEARLAAIPSQVALRYLQQHQSDFSHKPSSWFGRLFHRIQCLYHVFEKKLMPKMHRKEVETALNEKGFFSHSNYLDQRKLPQEDAIRLARSAASAA